MEIEIYKRVLKHIKDNVTDFRWIDSNEGQLTSTERPPVAYPACLIEMSYPSCRELSRGNQQVVVEIKLTCAWEILGSGNALVTESTLVQTLNYMQTLNKLHQCLQWWTGDGLWMPLKRIRVTPSVSRNGLRVVDAVYQLEYIDALEPQP